MTIDSRKGFTKGVKTYSTPTPMRGPVRNPVPPPPPPPGPRSK